MNGVISMKNTGQARLQVMCIVAILTVPTHRSIFVRNVQHGGRNLSRVVPAHGVSGMEDEVLDG